MRIDVPSGNRILDLRRLWQETFGDTDDFLNDFFSTAFDPSRARCVTVDGQLVAALYWFDCLLNGNCVAYIYAVATAKAYRGQGFCRRLMEDTHRHLKASGYEGAVLVPVNERLFEMYRKMGYETCGYIRKLRCKAEAVDMCISAIGKDEYAKLRRRYLPYGGVIQEHENLDFLETQFRMYKGTDCVFTAYQDKDVLVCKELLGNALSAPQIVHALKLREGVFRVPGGEGDTPFAMYYALNDTAPPAYFGLAFD